MLLHRDLEYIIVKQNISFNFFQDFDLTNSQKCFHRSHELQKPFQNNYAGEVIITSLRFL